MCEDSRCRSLLGALVFLCNGCVKYSSPLLSALSSKDLGAQKSPINPSLKHNSPCSPQALALSWLSYKFVLWPPSTSKEGNQNCCTS